MPNEPRSMFGVYYLGSRPEKQRIQSVINEWLSEQSRSKPAARYRGELHDGDAGELVAIVTRFHPAEDETDVSAELAAFLREYAWSAKP